jgi:ribosomal protein S18 acetylase RimI-like enzyme
MEIKPATIENAENILALQRLAYQSEAAIYDDFTIPPLTETLESMKSRFHDRRFLKAMEGGQIVGSVRAYQDGATCHVERLTVHPDYRRRGTGTALLNWIENRFACGCGSGVGRFTKALRPSLGGRGRHYHHERLAEAACSHVAFWDG